MKPHLRKCWCIPPQHNAEFVARMEDILELYCSAYNQKVPLICMDEQPRQLIKETRKTIAAQPGEPAREDYEYERNGTANIFLFTEPLAGKRYVDATERRTSVIWAHQIRELLDVHYPEAERIQLVMDNLNTHKMASLYEAFEPQEARRLAKRLDIHYTPKHGSWLNIAEIELSALTQQCLNRRMPDIGTLRKEIIAWEQKRNNQQQGVDWQFTTNDARVKLKRLYPQILT